MPTSAIVSVVLFLTVQAGTLIWFLSRINAELKQIHREIASGLVVEGDISHSILNHERRITRIEATCQHIDCGMNAGDVV